jgi:hypothetical protein
MLRCWLSQALNISIMRLRLILWGSLLMLQFLAMALPPEAIAPAVAGSIYVPLTVLRWLGLPVFTAAGLGGCYRFLGSVVVGRSLACKLFSKRTNQRCLTRRST